MLPPNSLRVLKVNKEKKTIICMYLCFATCVTNKWYLFLYLLPCVVAPLLVAFPPWSFVSKWPTNFIVIRVAAGSSPLHCEQCEHVDGHGKFHKAISIYLLNVWEGWFYIIYCATELLPCKHHARLRFARFRGNQNKFAENQHFFNLFWTKIDNTFLQFVHIYITAFCTF